MAVTESGLRPGPRRPARSGLSPGGLDPTPVSLRLERARPVVLEESDSLADATDETSPETIDGDLDVE